jgi:hypothetical protein
LIASLLKIDIALNAVNGSVSYPNPKKWISSTKLASLPLPELVHQK